jgi:hypothetical protein
MWASILMDLVPFFTAGGGGAVGWYMRNNMGQIHDPKPKTSDMSTYDIIKRGYDAMGAMAKDIHDLYHPPGCKCAICQIRADDDAEDPNAYTGSYCSLPCFNCSVITCPTHPDRRPPAKTKEKVTYKPKADVSASAKPPSQVTGVKIDKQNKMWVLVSEHEEGSRNAIAIRNLEAQLKSLTESYQEVVAQRDSLMNERGLRSAGMHVGGKPLYMVDERSKPASGPGSRPPFDLRAADEAHEAARKEQVSQLNHHQKLHPGYMIEEFGEGPIRYICQLGPNCDIEVG